MNLIQIDLRLTTRTHLTIGSGDKELLSSADITQLKRRNKTYETACIPASTFKGILRSSAIQIAHFFGYNYCTNLKGEFYNKHSKKDCIICQIFGASDMSSKVFCEDFFPIYKETINFQYLTRNKIKRKTGKSEEGSLFTIEQIYPNTIFHGSLIARNLSDKEQELLVASLLNMNFCRFGHSGGLIDLKIISYKNLNDKNELISQLLSKMIEK
ncbi:MAG: RAMP superfamily CRISPR-associated protein [Promethearchaeota archaeon]